MTDQPIKAPRTDRPAAAGFCMLCNGALAEEDRKPGRPMCACLLIGRSVKIIQDNAYTKGWNEALKYTENYKPGTVLDSPIEGML